MKQRPKNKQLAKNRRSAEHAVQKEIALEARAEQARLMRLRVAKLAEATSGTTATSSKKKSKQKQRRKKKKRSSPNANGPRRKKHKRRQPQFPSGTYTAEDHLRAIKAMRAAPVLMRDYKGNDAFITKDHNLPTD